MHMTAHPAPTQSLKEPTMDSSYSNYTQQDNLDPISATPGTYPAGKAIVAALARVAAGTLTGKRMAESIDPGVFQSKSFDAMTLAPLRDAQTGLRQQCGAERMDHGAANVEQGSVGPFRDHAEGCGYAPASSVAAREICGFNGQLGQTTSAPPRHPRRRQSA